MSAGCSPNTATTSVITVTDHPCYANAAFTYTAGSGGVVNFSRATVPSGGNIAWFWTFGDGGASTLASPSHTYASAGNYSVILLSYDATYSVIPGDTLYYTLPCKSVTRNNLNITGIPCIANSAFSVSPSWYALHYYVATVEYPYNVSAAVWDWGDGSSSNQLYSSHLYAAEGNYNICLTVTTSCGNTSSTCVTQNTVASGNNMLVINTLAPQPTGIKEQENEPVSLTLFPNPTEGIINIKLDKAAEAEELAVYDLIGKNVLTQPFASSEETVTLDVSQLNNGIYFLKVKLSGGTTVSKFIISK